MLRMRLRSNAAYLARRFEERKEDLVPALEQAAQDMAKTLERESRKVLQAEVYAVPIPRGKNGKPKWKRSRKLKAAETARPDGMRVLFENSMVYARARNALGTPKGRKIRSPGIKSVQWQKLVLLRRRAWILDQRRKAVLRALRGRALG